MSATATIADVLEGRARWCVITGDCLQVLPTLPDKSVAHVITDPPYSARLHAAMGNEARNDGTPAREALDFTHLTQETAGVTATEIARLLRRWVLVFCDELAFILWHEAITNSGMEHLRLGTWVKERPMPQLTGDRPASGTEQILIGYGVRPPRRNTVFPPSSRTEFREQTRWNGGGKAAVWYADNQEPGRVHPTQKPVALMLELAELFTDPDELILDPFCGSGTTGVAALRLGRRFIGIELSEAYAKVARERLTAEERGQSLREFRAGQLGLFFGETGT